MDSTSAIVSVTCVAASTPAAVAGVRMYRIYNEARLVNCPEKVEAAVVKIHATRAVASSLAGRNNLHLRSCSFWPEKKGCDQACVEQIREDLGGHRTRALPAKLRRATSRAASVPAGARRVSRA
jgi:hypothetical protein